MSILVDQRVIAIEEHYYDPNVISHYTGVDARTGGFVKDSLLEVGDKRIKSMDDSGIDVQVLSHGAPSTQRMDADTGIPVAKAANDYLFEICQANPQRLAGFAALPTADPIAAADELSRSVNQLGFKGAMIHGLIGEERCLSITNDIGQFLKRHRHSMCLFISTPPIHIRLLSTHI